MSEPAIAQYESELTRTRCITPRSAHPFESEVPLYPVSKSSGLDVCLPKVVFPSVGESFLHFELIEEFQRGSFSRVYLARQECLANRHVVLKITAHVTDEPQKLARLRHTNIVPVYSVHSRGPLQVVCMPYLGRVTLVGILARRPASPTSGGGLIEAYRQEARAAVEEALPEGWDALRSRTYCDAILDWGRQLAAGLAHAHARGIFHRDLKPANVLISADGVPMILDFNVSSESSKGGGEESVGGTLPYMAPEHLSAFLGKEERVDARSDLYSLGMVLYQLLAGRLPFEPRGDSREVRLLSEVLAERRTLPSPPSQWNPRLSPAVDSIILKCLDPDPERRYARAEQLQEDLARQLHDQPLAFARDSSLLERARKCQRRYPRLTTAVAATLFLLLPLGAIAYRQAELAARTRETQQAEATLRATEALADLQTAAILLTSRSDPAAVEQGYALVMPALSAYAVSEEGDWKDRPAVRKLSPELRADLQAAAAEVLILLPQVEAARGGSTPEALAAALEWNALAAKQFSNDERPAVIAWQRDEFEALARGVASPKRMIQPLDARLDLDLYFYGLELSAGDRYAEALPLLTAFCDRHPGHFRAWFARGVCHELLGQFADANAAFSVCVALRSELPQPHCNRGLARLKLHRYADAEADFTRALERKPGWSKALINRGLAWQALGQFAAAVKDFTTVLNEDSAPTRVYFLRSRARLAAGDKTGAAADKAEGLTRTPADALSFAARGKWRMDAGDWTGAIADCEAAVRLNPRCRDAMLNQAIVLADHLGHDAEAIPVLDKLLATFPNDAEALGGRGVYLARLGRAVEATRDAEAALKLDRSAFRYYQMAGLFAQLTKYDSAAATRKRALDLLNQAFRAGFDDWPTLKSDADLDPIRSDAGFIALVAAARRLDPSR